MTTAAVDKSKVEPAFFNRELSWLEFNDRVLREGLSPDVPLLERLRFLAIVDTNLEEFLMIRIAGLKQQERAGISHRDFSGLTPREQLEKVSARIRRLVADHQAAIREVFDLLAGEGLELVRRGAWRSEDRSALRSYWTEVLQPVLTPLAIAELDPPPLLAGQQLHVAFLVAKVPPQSEPRLVVFPVPAGFSRFIPLPGKDKQRFALLEEVVAEYAPELFAREKILESGAFVVIRDADVAIDEEDARDLLETVEQAVLARRRRLPVCMFVTADMPEKLKDQLIGWFGLKREEVYTVTELLRPGALHELVQRVGFHHLRYPDWPPQYPADFASGRSLWETIAEKDILLFHPYESFDPVIELLQQAAEDPNVLAIKQTLYRTSGDSPVVQALAEAARNGKEVTVIVELKARFDEARNVRWARMLEDAGCHVVYGLAGIKIHAKALLIVRRETGRIRRYVHLSTGNYNERTARVYSDIGFLTCDPEIAADVASLFNLLTGRSEPTGWRKIAVEPRQLKRKFLDLIAREALAASSDQTAIIMAKVNSLEDPDIIQALYEASGAGVKIWLNVRGICCLRPGVPGLSDNIEVRSIVDRFLEHARIFYFHNRGTPEVYLSSADWMRRNLDRRIELLWPVTDERLRRRLKAALDLYFADNVKAYRLQPDGTYERLRPEGETLRAQEKLYLECVEATRRAELSPMRFHPLQRPES
ncbi:MAG: polyphosphate kinase 1 [Thermoguttaceae bacterium]|nr:polyphosphate kinase 1 [Thermoguttaceae bacterium]MDW8078277.1 polyphosphate kinase 1 [Thermoguttaceae bacterium]